MLKQMSGKHEVSLTPSLLFAVDRIAANAAQDGLLSKQSNKWRNLLISKGIVVQSITEYPQKYPQNRSLPAQCRQALLQISYY